MKRSEGEGKRECANWRSLEIIVRWGDGVSWRLITKPFSLFTGHICWIHVTNCTISFDKSELLVRISDKWQHP